MQLLLSSTFDAIVVIVVKFSHRVLDLAKNAHCLGLFVAVKCVKSQNHPPFYSIKFCHRVLDLAKTAPQEAVTDEVSLLLAIKVGRKD